MKPLSTFLGSGKRSGRADRAAPGETHASFHCRPAQGAETAVALSLILADAGSLAGAGQVQDFIRYAEQRQINLALLRIAHRDDELLWAVLPVPSPGRTMLLCAPALVPDPVQAQAARQLIEGICADFAPRGIYLAQVLLDPAVAAAQPLYRSIGFEAMAELIYLQAAVGRRAAAPILGAGLSWETYSPAAHPRLATTIERTYFQSLDCPALNGLRAIEDVIAGHRATGEFDPQLWFLLCEAEMPQGVLLLNRTQQAEGMELVYLGLAPEARGRGLGDVLIRQALAMSARCRCARLSLAVDARNQPAMRLYYRHGMQRVCSKIALLRDLRNPPAAQGAVPPTSHPHVR